MISRELPNDLDAERSVLGGAMLLPEAADELLTGLSEEAFHAANHRAIFAAMRALAGRQEPIDETTVVAELRAAGTQGTPLAAYVANLTELVPTAANQGHYCRIVADLAMRRALLAAATAVAGEAYEATDEPARTLVDRCASRISEIALAHEDPTLLSGADLAKAQFLRLEAAREGRGVTGLRTGYHDLDAALGGLYPGNLAILAARPSMGKTALATSIAHAAAGRGVPTLFFSLEMGADELGDRLIAADARVDLGRLRRGEIDSAHWPKLAAAQQRLHAATMHVTDRAALSVIEVRALSRRHRARHGLGLIVVDYLQLMRGASERGKSREQEVSEISRGLKALAKELAVPVLALSQLNRGLEQRQDKRPILSDLRESGAIEQDADQVLCLYRDEYYNPPTQDTQGIAEVLIRKNRNGATTGDKPVLLRWTPQFAKFDNLSNRGAS